MVHNLDHTYVQTNGIRLHVIQAGPSNGPLVILLHGFPEYWRGWVKQIEPLASAGFRVLVPDQRGYNLSDKPKSIAAYRIDELAKDVVGLIHTVGREKATIVGHDWGAAVAWWTALCHPQVVERLVILNVPHPVVMMRTLRRSLEQLRKSWYVFAFQLPWLPEAVARNNDWQVAVEALRNTSRPGTFTDEDIELYRQAWWRKDAFTSMLNWYRAAVRHPLRFPDDVRIHVPTLVIWGAQDRFLSRKMAQPSVDLCDEGRLVMIEEATHWVQHEEAERVNELLLRFLLEHSFTPRTTAR